MAPAEHLAGFFVQKGGNVVVAAAGDEGGGTAGLQGFQCPIVPFAPAIDILVVCAIADDRLCYAVLLCVQNQGLLIPGCLCYLIHSE